jgi:hypothetical protein
MQKIQTEEEMYKFWHFNYFQQMKTFLWFFFMQFAELIFGSNYK